MIKQLKFAGLLLASAVIARPEWTVGRGALQLETSLSAVYDSNLNASVNNREDSYFDFYPLFRYRQSDARIQANGWAGVHIKRYQDMTESNSEDADARFAWTMVRDEDHTTGADLTLSYLEGTDAMYDVNEQVRSRLFRASVRGEVLVARRHVLSAGATYREDIRDLGSNQESGSGRAGYSYVGFTDGTKLNADYVYQRSRSTDVDTGATGIDQTARSLSASVVRPLYAEALASFTYGYRWLDRGTVEESASLEDNNGPFFRIALSGPFLPRKYFPKTTGTFRIAYEQADVPGMNDDSDERLVGQLNLDWQARERTNVTFYLQRSQELSIEDNTIVSFSTGVSVRQNVGQFLELEGGFSYENADFIGWDRVDDRYTVRISGRYSLSHSWSVRAGYSYVLSDSNAPLANFERHLVNLTILYAF